MAPSRTVSSEVSTVDGVNDRATPRWRCFSSVAAVTSSATSLNASTFDAALAATPLFVAFVSPHCGTCHALKPLVGAKGRRAARRQRPRRHRRRHHRNRGSLARFGCERISHDSPPRRRPRLRIRRRAHGRTISSNSRAAATSSPTACRCFFAAARGRLAARLERAALRRSPRWSCTARNVDASAGALVSIGVLLGIAAPLGGRAPPFVLGARPDDDGGLDVSVRVAIERSQGRSRRGSSKHLRCAGERAAGSALLRAARRAADCLTEAARRSGEHCEPSAAAEEKSWPLRLTCNVRFVLFEPAPRSLEVEARQRGRIQQGSRRRLGCRASASRVLGGRARRATARSRGVGHGRAARAPRRTASVSRDRSPPTPWIRRARRAPGATPRRMDRRCRGSALRSRQSSALSAGSSLLSRAAARADGRLGGRDLQRVAHESDGREEDQVGVQRRHRPLRRANRPHVQGRSVGCRRSHGCSGSNGSVPRGARSPSRILQSTDTCGVTTESASR